MDFSNEAPSSPSPEERPALTPPGSVAMRLRTEQLQGQYQSLETLFALTVSGLILMSLALNLFLFKQSRLARSQVQQQSPIVTRAVTEFHKSREPLVRSLVGALETFTMEDPQFRPIMEKYRPYLGQYFIILRPEGTNQAVPATSATNSATEKK